MNIKKVSKKDFYQLAFVKEATLAERFKGKEYKVTNIKFSRAHRAFDLCMPHEITVIERYIKKRNMTALFLYNNGLIDFDGILAKSTKTSIITGYKNSDDEGMLILVPGKIDSEDKFNEVITNELLTRLYKFKERQQKQRLEERKANAV